MNRFMSVLRQILHFVLRFDFEKTVKDTKAVDREAGTTCPDGAGLTWAADREARTCRALESVPNPLKMQEAPWWFPENLGSSDHTRLLQPGKVTGEEGRRGCLRYFVAEGGNTPRMGWKVYDPSTADPTKR